MNNQRQSKIALLINMISPARIPLYAGLAASFDLLILHGGTERNRDSWRDVHAMRAHAGNNPEKTAAIFGRSEFGLPPQDLAF